jgi:hypothetical protein
MAIERSSAPTTPPTGTAAPRSAAAPGPSPRPPVDRLTVGKLLNHGRAPHEFHPRGHPSYFVKILTDDGERTIWGRGLERALAKSRTQPQVGDAIGIRENNLAPVSFITRTRNAEGLVVATRQTDTPRPHWVIEKLEDFDLRAAAARALRDPTLSRREAVTNHRELGAAYWILDAAQKYATGRWESPKTRETFVAAVRETLALTVERGIELPEAAREGARSAVAPKGLQRPAARTRE